MSFEGKTAHEAVELEHGGLYLTPTVVALPDAAKTDGGILLEVDTHNASGLQLAKDGHVSRRDASRLLILY